MIEISRAHMSSMRSRSLLKAYLVELVSEGAVPACGELHCRARPTVTVTRRRACCSRAPRICSIWRCERRAAYYLHQLVIAGELM